MEFGSFVQIRNSIPIVIILIPLFNSKLLNSKLVFHYSIGNIIPFIQILLFQDWFMENILENGGWEEEGRADSEKQCCLVLQALWQAGAAWPSPTSYSKSFPSCMLCLPAAQMENPQSLCWGWEKKTWSVPGRGRTIKHMAEQALFF